MDPDLSQQHHAGYHSRVMDENNIRDLVATISTIDGAAVRIARHIRAAISGRPSPGQGRLLSEAVPGLKRRTKHDPRFLAPRPPPPLGASHISCRNEAGGDDNDGVPRSIGLCRSGEKLGLG